MKWLKFILGVMLVVALSSCNYVFLQIPPLVEEKPTYNYLKDRTVFISGKAVVDEEEMSWSGTGVVVKKTPLETIVLTNNHVAGGGLNTEELSIYVMEDERPILVSKIVRSKNYDMALLYLRTSLGNKKAISLGVTEALPSDKVYLVGHHLGRPYIYGEGVFAGYDETHAIIQVPTLYGNSGSGVFNSQGQLVGLVFAISVVGYFDVDCSHAIIVNGPDVKAFLEKNEITCLGR